MQSATAKWLPRVGAEIECEIPIMRRGRVVGECDHIGVAACDVCGRATCLDHGRIDKYGDIICAQCIADAQQAVPPLRRERARREQEQGTAQEPRSQRERAQDRQEQRARSRAQEPPPGQQPPPRRGPSPEQIGAALSALGLRAGASWPDVLSAHRKVSGANHPDRFVKKSRREQKEAETRYLAAQKALDLLRGVMQQ